MNQDSQNAVSPYFLNPGRRKKMNWEFLRGINYPQRKPICMYVCTWACVLSDYVLSDFVLF